MFIGLRKAGIHMKTLISADNTWALFAILVVVAALAIWMEQKYKWAGKVTGCVIALIGAMPKMKN